MACPNIDDYSVIGDCHGIALITAEGRIDWCALPALDSDPVFFRLLDDQVGGYLETRPHEAFRAQQRYLRETNVLETEFTSDHGTAIITDFMPLGRAAKSTDDGFSDVVAPHWLVRMIDVTHGVMTFDLRAMPSRHWGVQRATLQQAEYGVVWDGGCLLCDHPLQAHDYGASGTLHLRAGERARLILTPALPPDPAVALASVGTLLAVTMAYWTEWSQRCRYRGPFTDAVRCSALTLKLLTYAPSGAIAAAGTTSLPEVPGGDKNWDYRLSWVRDSTLSLFALSALGYREEPEAFYTFIFCHAVADIVPSQIVYSIHGERELAEREIHGLQGFHGSRPVRIGNEAYRQRQFDVFGELFDWMSLRHSLGHRLSPEQQKLLRRTADYVAAHWREPCSDFWEKRDEPAHYVYSKLMSWVALNRAQTLLECSNYQDTMDDIAAAIHQRGIAPAGYLRQQFGCDAIDAVALRVPLVDFPLPTDCLSATVDEVLHQLDTGVGIYRYKDEVGGGHGTFVACGFWLVDALLFVGRIQDARQRFEKLLLQANDLGLYAEEVDAQSGRHLGNFPQALSHLGLIHSAILLELVERHGHAALKGTHSHRVRQASAIALQQCDIEGEDIPHASDASVLDLVGLGLKVCAAA